MKFGNESMFDDLAGDELEDEDRLSDSEAMLLGLRGEDEGEDSGTWRFDLDR